MKVNTRQHFVPQFYLRHWADTDERLWQYALDGSSPAHVRVNNVGFERGIYSHPPEGSIPPLATEQELSKMEGLYASMWPGIIDQANDVQTRRNLARFMALMYLRHPNHQKRVAEMNAKLREAVDGVDAGTRVELVTKDGTASCLIEEMLEGTKPEEEKTKLGFLRLMRTMVDDIADVFLARRWGVIFSPNASFATCDSPIILDRGTCQKPVYGLGTPGTNVCFPICPTRMLVIEDSWSHEFAHYKLTDPDVFNRVVVRGSIRFAYSFANDSAFQSRIPQWRA